MLKVKNLKKYFEINQGFFNKEKNSQQDPDSRI